MSEIEFRSFGKIARLLRDVVITEKIDGTQAAVGIVPFYSQGVPNPGFTKTVFGPVNGMGIREATFVVYAQSRTCLIHPGLDNHGFARWVWDNADYLVENLGEGLHFGEWWGSGINRGYGLVNGVKRFSLFNTHRWGGIDFDLPTLDSVPVLYKGMFSTSAVHYAMYELRAHGSKAAPGYDRPEGVVLYHRHANVLFKATLEHDDMPKSLVDNGS